MSGNCIRWLSTPSTEEKGSGGHSSPTWRSKLGSAVTTLSGVDLYPNVLAHLANIRNLRGHPYEFYQKLGFVLVGVMPDANGPGKPDIYMAKRVARE